MLFTCCLQHTVVPLLLCGKREAEHCSEAAFRRSWLCIELLCLQSELEGAGGRYIVPQDEIAHSCRQLSTFQQVVLLLSQLFSFCAVSIRRTEADTGLS